MRRLCRATSITSCWVTRLRMLSSSASCRSDSVPPDCPSSTTRRCMLSRPYCSALSASFRYVVMATWYLYYSKFAKAHTMFVMEQSWNGSHPETHWKHETPLPGCDCITWVTHKLLTVVAAGNWIDWEMFMTWKNILKPPFWEVWGKPQFLGVCFFDDRTHVTCCLHLVHSNEIQEINMSSNTCCF